VYYQNFNTGISFKKSSVLKYIIAIKLLQNNFVGEIFIFLPTLLFICFRQINGDMMVLTECEIYSRVCGYLRPVANWNDSKQSEFNDRILFDDITDDIYKPNL